MSNNNTNPSAFFNAGFSVLPVTRDLNLVAGREHGDYLRQQPTPQEFAEILDNFDSSRYGIACGTVSGIVAIKCDSDGAAEALAEKIDLTGAVEMRNGEVSYYLFDTRRLSGLGTVYTLLGRDDLTLLSDRDLAPVPGFSGRDGREYTASADLTDRDAIAELPAELVKLGREAVKESEGPVGGYLALGYTEDAIVVMSLRTSTIRHWTPTALERKSNLISICGSDWIWQNYRGEKKNGDVFPDYDRLVANIITDAQEAGIYKEGKVKAAGVYTAPDNDDVLIVNSSTLWATDGREMSRAGDNITYKAHLDIDLDQEAEPATREEINFIVDTINQWNWALSGDPSLYLGWLTTAVVPGALEQRPYIILTGQRGGGKTSLQKLGYDLLGKTTEWFPGRSTVAGIRQNLHGAARSFIVDEAEAGEGDNTSKIIGLLRDAYSDEEGTARGTVDQKGLRFSLQNTACLSAIQPPSMLPADVSRSVTLEILPQKPGVKAPEMVRNRGKARALGPKFKALVLQRWPVMRQSKLVIAGALSERRYENRTCDTLGTLLAGAWAIQHDSVITTDEAETLLATIDLATHTESESAHDEIDALNRLLSGSIRVDNQELSISEAVVRALIDSKSLSGKALERHGIKVSPRPYDSPTLSVVASAEHPGLIKIFSGSRYEGGWSRLLGRIDGAVKGKAARVDGRVAKVVTIPMPEDLQQEANGRLNKKRFTSVEDMPDEGEENKPQQGELPDDNVTLIRR